MQNAYSHVDTVCLCVTRMLNIKGNYCGLSSSCILIIEDTASPHDFACELYHKCQVITGIYCFGFSNSETYIDNIVALNMQYCPLFIPVCQ